jgi:hypothetical protein
MPKVRKPDTEGLEGLQLLWSSARDFLPKLRQNDVLGELLCILQRSTGDRVWKSKMQGRTKDWQREMYKMWQTSQMVSLIAAIHQKLCG